MSSNKRFDLHSTSYLDEESTKCTIPFLAVSPAAQVDQSWIPARSLIPPSARYSGGTPAIDHHHAVSSLESSQHFINELL